MYFRLLSVLVVAAVAGCLPSTHACTRVATWRNLTELIDQADEGSKLILCPFRLLKPSNEVIHVTKLLSIKCQIHKRCILQGRDSHIHVTGVSGQLYIKGFVFQGATTSALVIDTLSGRPNVISKCKFRVNGSVDSLWRGGAIRAGPETVVRVFRCLFLRNQAQLGAAIFHQGAWMSIDGSAFLLNHAAQGAIVHLADGALGELSNLSFIGNGADNGGVLSTDRVGALKISETVVGYENGGCDGLVIRLRGKCFGFGQVVYRLGQLRMDEYGIVFSQGLIAEMIARSGEQVAFSSPEASAAQSSTRFHAAPDGAAIFGLEDGGFVYVSNAEVDAEQGGVYALEFDSDGLVRDYKPLLTGTTRNCNGGLTPWNTFISCEEYPKGQCWQVEPMGRQSPMKTVLGGSEGGSFEAVAVDFRDLNHVCFYVSEDHESGPIRQYCPREEAEFGWAMLHGEGVTSYLEFLPQHEFRWTSSLEAGRASAYTYYRNVEGIAHHDGELIFVSKAQQEIFRLDLDRKVYTVQSTKTDALAGGGRFAHEPDSLLWTSDGHIYFTEDGGKTPGIFAFDGSSFQTVLEAYSEVYFDHETSGVEFSPDGMSMFFCIQESGFLFQVKRIDGYPFEGRRVLKWKYNLGRR